MLVNMISKSIGPKYAGMGRIGIMHNGNPCSTSLSEVTFTLELYCRKIILDHVFLSRSVISPYFLLMVDNACPHRNTEASDTLETEDINYRQWLANSLDLNPIKHVCDASYRCSLQITRPT